MISRQRYHPFLRGINIRESLQLPSILSEIVAPSIGGTVHLCTLDAFYFIFREIPVNQTAFIFIKSYGIPSHSTCLENDSGQEELCGTLECENEREKGKKKKGSRSKTVTMDALPFNGYSSLFSFFVIEDVSFRMMGGNVAQKRDIDSWLEKYFTVNIFRLRTRRIVYRRQGFMLSAFSLVMYNFVEGIVQ